MELWVDSSTGRFNPMRTHSTDSRGLQTLINVGIMNGVHQNQNRIELVRARLPPYEPPPPWIPPQERVHHPDYNNDIREFLPRELILQRMRASEQLGFNIRGGQEHHCGIFVSKVMPNSEADKLGLREGDQILTVNKRDFTNIDHAEAV